MQYSIINYSHHAAHYTPVTYLLLMSFLKKALPILMCMHNLYFTLLLPSPHWVFGLTSATVDCSTTRVWALQVLLYVGFFQYIYVLLLLSSVDVESVRTQGRLWDLIIVDFGIYGGSWDQSTADTEGRLYFNFFQSLLYLEMDLGVWDALFWNWVGVWGKIIVGWVFFFLIIWKEAAQKEYGWPLNNRGLNLAGPLTHGIFSVVNTIALHDLCSVESEDTELRIQRAVDKLYLAFLLCGGQCPLRLCCSRVNCSSFALWGGWALSHFWKWDPLLEQMTHHILEY